MQLTNQANKQQASNQQFSDTDIVTSTNICSDTNNFSITDIIISAQIFQIKGDLLIIKNIRFRNKKIWNSHTYTTKIARVKTVIATPISKDSKTVK
jgi:hypothetical protein